MSVATFLCQWCSSRLGATFISLHAHVVYLCSIPWNLNTYCKQSLTHILNICKRVSIQLFIWYTQDSSLQYLYDDRPPPHICLSSVYPISLLVSKPPRPSPSILHTQSNQTLEVVNAWDEAMKRLWCYWVCFTKVFKSIMCGLLHVNAKMFIYFNEHCQIHRIITTHQKRWPAWE